MKAPRAIHACFICVASVVLVAAFGCSLARAAGLDAAAITKASGTTAVPQADGVVKIGWPRTDVPVTVDGMRLPPPAGLGSWAAFKLLPNGTAMVMGDTVVFADEVDAAMDAAFANGLTVTAIHNHFFHDQPRVYFMHMGGEGEPETLAMAVKSVWGAIRAVRNAHAQPVETFGSAMPSAGDIDATVIERIVGAPAPMTQGVAKVTIGRTATMHGTPIGGSMGLTTWAAFAGSDRLAVMDGDFIMTAAEVQPVLAALRKVGVHVVALHTHMIGESPTMYFAHFWAKGSVPELARSLHAALDAQAAAGKS
jgi:Domain of Unknown Function (DUF1259)